MDDRARSTRTPRRTVFPWHVVAGLATAMLAIVGIRALLAPLRLFPVVEWALALLVGVVAALVVTNVVLARMRARER